MPVRMPRPHPPLVADPQRAERPARALRHPHLPPVQLSLAPAGQLRPAAEDDALALARRPHDRRLGRAGISRRQHERLLELVGAALNLEGDRAGQLAAVLGAELPHCTLARRPRSRPGSSPARRTLVRGPRGQRHQRQQPMRSHSPASDVRVRSLIRRPADPYISGRISRRARGRARASVYPAEAHPVERIHHRHLSARLRRRRRRGRQDPHRAARPPRRPHRPAVRRPPRRRPRPLEVRRRRTRACPSPPTPTPPSTTRARRSSSS